MAVRVRSVKGHDVAGEGVELVGRVVSAADLHERAIGGAHPGIVRRDDAGRSKEPGGVGGRGHGGIITALGIEGGEVEELVFDDGAAEGSAELLAAVERLDLFRWSSRHRVAARGPR